MPSLNNDGSGNDPTIEFKYHFAEVKQSWDDDWEFVPYLQVLDYKRAVAPEVPRAKFKFAVGDIMREDDTTFQQYSSVDYKDWYIRVKKQSDNDDPQVMWTGIVVDQEINYDRDENESGDEILTAYGPSHLLDRNIIGTSIFDNGNEETDDTNKVDWVMPFNLRPQAGFQLKGNRSDAEFDSSDGLGSSYIFSSDGNTWSNTDIINYLLVYHTPADITFNLIGQTESLDDTDEYYNFKKSTCWGALKRLIKDKKGLGFRVEVNDNNEVDIRVFTVVDSPVQVGSKTLPANDNQISLTLPSGPPYTHLVDTVPFNDTAANQFSKIIVRGQRAKCVCPFGADSQGNFAPLKKGWLTSLETTYQNASTSQNPDPDQQDDSDKNDKFRSQDKFHDVYRKLIVPEDWDGTLKDGTNVLPIPQDDGTVSEDEDDGDPIVFTFQKKFSRTTPFKKSVDYSTSPPTDNRPDQTKEAEFIPLIAFYFDEDDGDSHSADAQWHLMDKLSFGNEDLKDLHVAPLDNQLGVMLHCTPNHYLALNHWPDSAAETNHEPELDWENVMVVGMWETDRRQQVVIDNPDVDNDRVLIVDVPAARYIYAVEDCPIDVDDDGTLRTIDNDERVLFDDGDTLQTIASQLAAWHFPFRQAVELHIKQPGFYAELGAFLTEIDGIDSTIPVGTVVTSVDTDVVKQTSTVRTSYFELDYTTLKGIAGRAEDLGSTDDED